MTLASRPSLRSLLSCPNIPPLPGDDDASLDRAALDPDRRGHLEDLVQTIKEYADKLAADGTSRGDLKVISRTLQGAAVRLQGVRPLSQAAESDRLWLGPHAARRAVLPSRR